MLTIITDIEDTAWLNYILEEWRRIQEATFEIQIHKLKDEELEVGNLNILYYTHSAPQSKKLWIPQKAQTHSELCDIDGMHLIKESVIDKTVGNTFYFDVLWNAFYFLSRKEEYDAEKEGKRINSYSKAHPRVNKISFQRPIVNQLFQLLENIVRKHYKNLHFGLGHKMKIELSHDLDYINKTAPLLIKQTAMNSYKTLKAISTPKYLGKYLKKTFHFLFNKPSYWCFEYWSSVEAPFKSKSIFYVYAKRKEQGLKNWLLDPSYSISNNEKLKDELKSLIDHGHEVGLHGSFYSAENKGFLEEEKGILENALGITITKGRQHWLRYRESITPFLHEELFEIDSTIGFNDIYGFRAGTCSQYRPYNHKDKRPFNYWITPQFVMDSNIFEYSLFSNPSTHSDKIQTILEECKSAYKNIHLTISWHPRTASNDYNWHIEYERLLNYKRTL